MGNKEIKIFDNPYDTEIINGVEFLLCRCPNICHNEIFGNIYVQFHNFLKETKQSHNIFFKIEVELEKNMNVVIPDVAIVCDPEKIANGQRIEGAPDLVVEVLSPSTALRDMTIKKEVYEKHGVKEYWIVSPDEKAVQIFILKDGQFGKSTVYILEDGKDSPIIITSLYGDDLKISLEEIFAQ